MLQSLLPHGRASDTRACGSRQVGGVKIDKRMRYDLCSDTEGSLCVKREKEREREGLVAMSSQKQLLKLSEESLMKEPEEVFDLEEKIGEG